MRRLHTAFENTGVELVILFLWGLPFNEITNAHKRRMTASEPQHNERQDGRRKRGLKKIRQHMELAETHALQLSCCIALAFKHARFFQRLLTAAHRNLYTL